MPWKSIGTSVPFWALCISHMLNNFGWYMLLVELPLFMSNGLGFNIKQVQLETIEEFFYKSIRDHQLLRPKVCQKISVIKTNTCDKVTKVVHFVILIHVLS